MMRDSPTKLVLLAALAISGGAVLWFASNAAQPPRGAPAGASDADRDASTPAAASPQEPPSLLYAAFTAGGPIVTGIVGRVDETGPAAAAGESVSTGTLVLAVDRVLRGGELAKTLELPFSHRPPSPRWPAVLWDRVPPEPGKHVLVILAPEDGSRESRCVLDLDGEDAVFLPVLERMLELEALPAGGGRTQLLAALQDPSPLVRALAVELLLDGEGGASPAARSELLEALSVSARDAGRPLAERLHTLALAGLKLYDRFSADDPVNHAVLSFLAGRITDPELRVRGEAVMILHGYLLGAGTLRPSVTGITFEDRERVRAQLAKDIESRSDFAAAADELLKLLAQEKGDE